MLNLTSTAGQHLQHVNSGSPEGTTIRLIPGDRGYKMTFDKKREGDTVVEHDDQPVLLMEAEVAKNLDNYKIDVVQTAEGTQLQILQ